MYKIAAEYFKSFCLIFLTLDCYNEFFVKFNFIHVPCLKAAISKALGLGIVVGSIFVKVPQIIKIYGAKSAEGISFASVILELCAIIANVSYNFVNKYPFSAYGDGFFLLLQTSLVGSFILYYGGSPSISLGFFISVGTIFLTFCSGLVPMSVLWGMQATNIPIILSAKMVQAFSNYQNGSTGQLSAITLTMLFLGALARIFTSIQETGDSIIILTYCAATFANGVLMAQLIYYWNVPLKPKKD